MKSVLMSIQLYWVFLIIAHKMGWQIGRAKTVEVRKNYPKAEDWDKTVKLYCSKDKKSFARIPKEYQPLMEQFLCKVVGEFVCDKVDRIAHCGTCNNDIRLNIVDKNFYYKALDYEYLNKCKLSYSEIEKYSNGGDVYGWRISNLVIYDKPKELGEFSTLDNKAIQHCEHRERAYQNPDFTNGAWLLGSYVCNKDETDWCTKCKTKPVTRPPQSWCYVESEVDT